MSIVDSINRLFSLFLDTFRQIPRGKIWVWLLIYFLIDWLVLYVLYDFTSPVFYGIVKLWTSLFSEQQAVGFSHYPGHFILLPHFYDWAKLAVGVIFEGLFLGAAALLFYENYVRIDPEDKFSFKTLMPSWIHLILAFIIVNAVLVGINLVAPMFLREWLAGSPRRILLFEWVLMPGIFTFVLALFFFMFASVVIYRDNVIQALSRSLRVFIHNPVTTYILAGMVIAMPIIIANVTSNTTKLVQNFTPEIIYWLLVLGLVIDIIVHFIWMGTSVRLLVEEEE